METVQEIQIALEKIDIPPKKQNCWRKALNRGSWPIRKESITEALGTIERLKTDLQVHSNLEIRSDVCEVKVDVREMKSNVVAARDVVGDIHTGQQGLVILTTAVFALADFVSV